MGLPREIQEVRNAFAAYEKMDMWQARSQDDLLAAHGLLMSGLVDHAGQFRSGGVAVYRDQKIVHMAPPASRVHTLIHDLLHWLQETDLHPLIASCIFHYEFEFIHPFPDGNGRMGRLWQTLILKKWQPLLAYLPVETVLREKQETYYEALSASDAASDSTFFVEFMLQALHQAMKESSVKSSVKTEERIMLLLQENNAMTISEMATALKLSTRAIEKQISKLKASGRLKRFGSDKQGAWMLLSLSNDTAR